MTSRLAHPGRPDPVEDTEVHRLTTALVGSVALVLTGTGPAFAEPPFALD